MEDRKLIQDFLNAHTRHLPQCQNHQSRCPLCNIIVHEQTDIYPTLLEDLFRPIILKAWKRWDAQGHRIANNTEPETLISYLAFSALSRWVQPNYHDIPDLSEEELYRHPFVIQKKSTR